MPIINNTPHAIVAAGQTFYPEYPAWRVRVSHRDTDPVDGVPTYLLDASPDEVEGVEPPATGCRCCSVNGNGERECGVSDGDTCKTFFIVSQVVANALKGTRNDLLVPATGHPLAVRKDGQIVSVPGFVRA